MKKIISIMILLVFLLGCSPSFYFEDHTLAGDKYVLRNGLTVIVKKNPSTDLAVFDLFVKTGALTEQGRNGISYLTSRMLFTGTKDKNREELVDFLESKGGNFKVMPSIQYNDLRIVVPSSEISVALKFLVEILTSPSFEEFDKEKKFVLDEIKEKKDSPFVVADLLMYSKLYAGTPYANPVEGSEESVNSISLDEVKDYFQKWYVPNNMILVVSGNVNDDLIDEINKVFSFVLKMKEVPLISFEFSDIVSGKFEENKFTDSYYIEIGYRTAPAVNEDYIKLKVLNGLLGEGPASRLYFSLREEQSLAYRIESASPTIKDTGLFRITIVSSDPEKAVSEALKQVEKVKNEAISLKELNEVKSRVKGRYAIMHQKSYDKNEYLGIYEVVGKGFDFDHAYPFAVDQVSSLDVQEMAKKYLVNPVIVVVGPVHGGEVKSVLE